MKMSEYAARLTVGSFIFTPARFFAGFRFYAQMR